MRFVVLPPRTWSPPAVDQTTAFLVRDKWNDFGFETQFDLIVSQPKTPNLNVGSIKIGRKGLMTGAVEIPNTFATLGDEYFAVGQEDDYYRNLQELSLSLRTQIFEATRDMAWDSRIFRQFENEDALTVSLLRTVSASAILNRFSRIARGQSALTPYAFRFTLFQPEGPSPIFDFSVEPHSIPPSNVHAIIGRNGSGKTRLLNGMIASLLSVESSEEPVGQITVGTDGRSATSKNFANVVTVTFSAFDPFLPLSDSVTRRQQIKYSYVGLKQVDRDIYKNPDSPVAEEQAALKSQAELSLEFGQSLRASFKGQRRLRWRAAMVTLEADPNFADHGLSEMSYLTDQGGIDAVVRRATQIFNRLSSGHALVLLTMTRLIEKVEERSLVLIDEPEAHLHPPLLSALVRCICDLLEDQNGVAVIATHSPVVLQELPSNCVTRIERSGNSVSASRPSLPTFGENVGTLTREIFGLEVTRTGFYEFLRQLIAESYGFDDVYDALSGKIGGEALAILRSQEYFSKDVQ